MKKLNDFEFFATAKRAEALIGLINAKLSQTEKALALHVADKKAA
ncbi:hypothetical protein [Pseudomonas sp. PA27(2017)]|nr:hypothetical protein [Pseudomonas sp. PA27(2017)]